MPRQTKKATAKQKSRGKIKKSRQNENAMTNKANVR